MYRPDVEVVAICDIDPKAIDIALKMVSDKGRKLLLVYGKTEKDFENLAKRADIDGVVIATPWEWHVPMALEVMKQGKYAGCRSFCDCYFERIVGSREYVRENRFSLHDIRECMLPS